MPPVPEARVSSRRPTSFSVTVAAAMAVIMPGQADAADLSHSASSCSVGRAGWADRGTPATSTTVYAPGCNGV